MTEWYVRLKEIRDKYSYSQAELAENIGVDETTISRYEKGKGSKKLTSNFRLKLKQLFSNHEIEYIEHGGRENHLAAMFGHIVNKSNTIGNTLNSSNVTQNSHNGAGGSGLTAEEETLIKYFRKRDEETQEKIMAFALTGKCDS